MISSITYKIRTVVFMVLSMLLLSISPVQAGFIIKKASTDKPLFSKNTTRIAMLSEKLAAFKHQKGSFFSRAIRLLPHQSRLYHGYGEKSGSNILSIISLVCGCLAYASVFVAAYMLLFIAGPSAAIAATIGGAVFALAAIITGAIALNKHKSRGMAIAGIILGSILLTLYLFIWLILLSYG